MAALVMRGDILPGLDLNQRPVGSEPTALSLSYRAAETALSSRAGASTRAGLEPASSRLWSRPLFQLSYRATRAI